MRAFMGCLAAAGLLAGCGQGTPTPVSPNAEIASLDAEPRVRSRPCTLLSAEEAAEIGGAPFLRTMADNRVLGAVTSCSYAIGAGGMHGLVQVNVVLPTAESAPDAFFAARCAQDVARTPIRRDDVGEWCLAASGAAVARFEGAVLEVTVQGGMGEVDAAATEALLARVAPRLADARP